MADYWSTAVRELSQRDTVLARLIDRAGTARLQLRTDPFLALGRAIVGQQISVKAAQAVWARVNERVPSFLPAHVLATEPALLAAAGLSQQKTRYLIDLATHFHTGSLDPGRWAAMDDEAVIADLVRVKGIGRWTAEMFLIFHLERPDVLPIDDLGLQRAIRLHYNRGRPLSQKKLRNVTQVWSPWRSVATWYLWRSLDPIPL
jgi:DNA-3-methyladenine glycosylase II